MKQKHLTKSEIIFNEKKVRELSLENLEKKYAIWISDINKPEVNQELLMVLFNNEVKNDVTASTSLYHKGLISFGDMYNKLIGIVAYDMMFSDQHKKVNSETNE